MVALPPEHTTRARQGWISDRSWRFLDQLNTLRRVPETLNQTIYCRLSRSLKAAGALVEMELSERHTRQA